MMLDRKGELRHQRKSRLKKRTEFLAVVRAWNDIQREGGSNYRVSSPGLAAIWAYSFMILFVIWHNSASQSDGIIGIVRIKLSESSHLSWPHSVWEMRLESSLTQSPCSSHYTTRPLPLARDILGKRHDLNQTSV